MDEDLKKSFETWKETGVEAAPEIMDKIETALNEMAVVKPLDGKEYNLYLDNQEFELLTCLVTIGLTVTENPQILDGGGMKSPEDGARVAMLALKYLTHGEVAKPLLKKMAVHLRAM